MLSYELNREAARPKAASTGARAPANLDPSWTHPFCVALFGLLWTCYVYVHQDYSGGTSISRLDLLHALFEEGTLRIDTYHANTSDKALFDGHYYSDKAPGAAVLALPGFALATGLLRLNGSSLETPDGWLFSSWLATATSAGLFTALGGVFCFYWLARWTEPKAALLTALALFLGSLPFPYATMLFSHGTVVGLLAIALWALDRGGQGGPTAPRRTTLAGLCCGGALASEFTAGLMVIALGGIACMKGRLEARRFLLGMSPPLLLIPAYSWLCFGTPFTLGYSHQAYFPQMHRGLYGIQWPDLATALKLLGSTDRGLFWLSPFILMALLGYRELWQRSRHWFWICLLLPAAQLAIISGNTWDWRAGWTLGPRYLAPVLPLLALPVAFGIRHSPRLGLILVTVSVALTGLGTFVDATPRYEVAFPLLELHLAGIRNGPKAYNLGQALGLGGGSIVPCLAIAALYGRRLWQEMALLQSVKSHPTPCASSSAVKS